ncbi:MAG: GNAT family N-acetyltransferase [Flavobacteriaceae bacterium]|nr:GNAT family N-acetyltransferase [Flavobacteriaceae bacterium]
MLKYKDFSLIKPNPSQEQKISEVIDQYYGSIFHEVELNRIASKQFNTELYYLVDDPETINSLTPIHISRDGRLGMKRYNFMPLGDIPYAGFVGKENYDPAQLKASFFESLKYMGFPSPNNANASGSSPTEIGETAMVDLSMTEDEIFMQSIHSKRRNMIRKAVKSGIEVRKCSDPEGLSEFWTILKGLHERLGYKNLNYEYYESICETYFSTGKAQIWIAYKEGKAISGILVLGNSNYLHYYKGASLKGIKNEGHGELLQWEAMKWAKEQGTKFYDLCNLDQEKLPAIYRFKTGISNNIIRYNKLTKNNLGYRIMKRI